MTSPQTYFGSGYTLPGIQDQYNGFNAKYAADGRLIWAKNIGVNEHDYNYSRAILVNKKGDFLYCRLI